MRKPFTFYGFSTSGKDARRHKWKLYDNDLIAQDLLNHFNTRMGGRLGRPTFGCLLWSYFMQQKTADVVASIRDEVERVCNSDPRIEFINQTMIETERGIIVFVQLKSRLNGQPWDLKIDFDERQGIATRG